MDDKTTELLHWARCALLDLEQVMPEYEPSGDRLHAGWKTIQGLKKAIEDVEADALINTLKQGITKKLAEVIGQHKE